MARYKKLHLFVDTLEWGTIPFTFINVTKFMVCSGLQAWTWNTGADLKRLARGFTLLILIGLAGC